MPSLARSLPHFTRPRDLGRFVARLACGLLLSIPDAAAAEAAPGLPLESLRQEASDALARLATLRPLPVGIYVAFDPDPIRPYVLPACDDDGDAVIVLSDAALTLSEYASYALAHDQRHGTGTRAQYGRLLATSQGPSARLLPPGAEFFRGVDAVVETDATAHFRTALSFWVGRAASVHDAQEFRCARPDSLRERGDASWTTAERTLALARASRLDPARDLHRTTWSLAGLLALGGDQRSAETLAGLAGRHPWRGPFPLPPADVVQATARALRAAAPAPVATAAPRSEPSRPPLPRSLARFGRRTP